MSEEDKVKKFLREFRNFAGSKAEAIDRAEKSGVKLSDNAKRERDFLRETKHKRHVRDKENWGE